MIEKRENYKGGSEGCNWSREVGHGEHCWLPTVAQSISAYSYSKSFHIPGFLLLLYALPSSLYVPVSSSASLHLTLYNPHYTQKVPDFGRFCYDPFF